MLLSIIFQNEHAKLCVTNVKLIFKNIKVLWILHRKNIEHVLDCKLYGKIVGQILISLTKRAEEITFKPWHSTKYVFHIKHFDFFYSRQEVMYRFIGPSAIFSSIESC